MGESGRSDTTSSRATAYSGIVFLLFVGMLLVGHRVEPGTSDYARFHLAVAVSCLLFFSLFLVRLKHHGIRQLPSRLMDPQGWRRYASSGALGPDVLLLSALWALVVIVDWGVVSRYRLRIGAVSAVVIVQLVLLVMRRARSGAESRRKA